MRIGGIFLKMGFKKPLIGLYRVDAANVSRRRISIRLRAICTGAGANARAVPRSLQRHVFGGKLGAVFRPPFGRALYRRMTVSVTSRWIDIPAGSDSFGAYLALPKSGKGPAVIIIQEIFGVNSHIRAVTEQYAQDGYVAIAPDIFCCMQPCGEWTYAGA